MLCWQVWNQCKALGVRPSELYNVTWPLAAFYFDRGIYYWGTFVERRMDEAEQTVRNQMKNRRGTDVFVTSARIVAYNKLFGLSVASAYRQPQLPATQGKPTKTKPYAHIKPMDPSKFSG